MLLTFDSLPLIYLIKKVVADKVAEAKEVEDSAAAAEGGSTGAGGGSGPGAAALLYKVPEFAALGPVFRSCRPLELSESETECVCLCLCLCLCCCCCCCFCISVCACPPPWLRAALPLRAARAARVALSFSVSICVAPRSLLTALRPSSRSAPTGMS